VEPSPYDYTLLTWAHVFCPAFCWALLAKLDFEEQMGLQHRRIKPFEELLIEKKKLEISTEVAAKNVIFVAELNETIVGLCWCTIVDNSLSKVGEIEEFYVMPQYRGKGIGVELLRAATNLFKEEKVEVAFVWTLKERKAAIEAYKKAGFKKCREPVFYYSPSENK
jgi:ribosomal protein S18 acetylase RimI-like enzyme